MEAQTAPIIATFGTISDGDVEAQRVHSRHGLVLPRMLYKTFQERGVFVKIEDRDSIHFGKTVLIRQSGVTHEGNEVRDVLPIAVKEYKHSTFGVLFRLRQRDQQVEML